MPDSAVTAKPPEAGAKDFMVVAEPFRRELLAHCYRMLGSVHDAEDTVQETYVRAWRAYERFEGRSSLRNWLYRIATNACLRTLEQRGRRPLPSGLRPPSDDPDQRLVAAPDTPWLQPMPDSLVEPPDGDPSAIAVMREGIRLAFIAALQHLPPRQRAALILRDVLQWQAPEVADLLGMTTAAVNSALQRARTHLADAGLTRDALAAPDERERRLLLDRYVSAFERADLDGLVQLLNDDIVIEMPPHPLWFTGLDVCRRFLAERLGPPGDSRLMVTSANGQPAVAKYQRGADGVYRPHAIQVLTMHGPGIARITAFIDPEMFEIFSLPRTT